MHVQVGSQPTSIGTYQYRVNVGGRSTTGYRKTQAEAHSAAREDGEMLHLAARMDFERRETEGTGPRDEVHTPRRLRQRTRREEE